MASSLQHMATSMIERSRTLINNDLKRICKEEGRPQTGNKVHLQHRVILMINEALQNSEAATLRRLQHRIMNHGEAPPSASTSTSASTTLNPAAPSFTLPHMPTANAYTMGNGYSRPSPAPAYASQAVPQRPPPTYFFKDSPFFDIRETILSNITLEASPGHRQNCTRNVIINESIGARLKADPTLRLMLFSTTEQPLAPYTRLDVAFPQQIEVRINNDEVKANYKGLKNKPGSTRPADITKFVRLTPANYPNKLVITYALTQKASQNEKFTLFVYMVKTYSAQELTQQIIGQRVITKESVLAEMSKKANDPDIEFGSSVMSLKDPISTLRIKTPCRSMICTHNQCFDAESFLLLQEQAPTWTCPICSKIISFNGLAVDQYVQEILSKVKNADQVTIEASGEWSLDKTATPPRNGPQDDSDDDLIEILDYRVATIKEEATLTPTSLSTPPLPSRETSTVPRSGNKRTAEVVDLTLSDDDEPPRPAKKVAYRTPSSIPDPSHRYQLPPIGHASAENARIPPFRTLPQSSRSDRTPPPTTSPDRPQYTAYPRYPPPARPNYPRPGSHHSIYSSSSP